MHDEHVAPQNPDLENSPKGEETVDEAAGDNFCYWNDKKYSDGATVCDNHQRFKCWNGKWVDIGNC